MNKLFNKLLNSSSGKIYKVFYKMRDLPERPQTTVPNLFEKGLKSFAEKRLRLESFNPLKENLQQGEIVKRNSMFHLLNVT